MGEQKKTVLVNVVRNFLCLEGFSWYRPLSIGRMSVRGGTPFALPSNPMLNTMKPTLFLSAVAFVALPVLAIAEEAASPANEVKAAAAKLTEASGYAWKTTSAIPESGSGQGRGNRFRPGPSEGKINKEGFALIRQTRGDNTSEALVKNGKTVVKTADGWKTGEELREQRRGERNDNNANDGDRRRGRGFGGNIGANFGRTFKAPAVQASELAGKTTELKKEGDTIKGDLTAAAAKELLSFGGPRRDGREGPQIDDPRGSVTFWIKDGALAKYEVKVAGSVSFNNNTRSLDRTTTTEISDVGSVTIDLPEEVKKKLE